MMEVETPAMPPSPVTNVLRIAAFAAAFALPAPGQTQSLPNGFLTVDGNGSSSFPLNTAADHKWQWHYDAGQFVSSAPIRITEIWIRASTPAAAVAAFSFPSFNVTLASSPTHYAIAASGATPGHSPDFELNLNPDATVVRAGPWSGGPVPAPGGATATWIPLGLSSSFVYDPGFGDDFVIQIEKCGSTALWGTPLDGRSAAAGVNGGNRYGHTSSCGATTQNFSNNEFVPIVKIDYVPAGLGARFSAGATSGYAPLSVAFTDLSVTTDPGGITSWSWDFENDGFPDDTSQNPVHFYPTPGQYSVRLTVTDAANPLHSRVIPWLIDVWPAPVWETNDPFSSLDVNGQTAAASGVQPAISVLCSGNPPASANVQSTLTGLPYDIMLTAAALVPSTLPLPPGILFNLDVFHPTFTALNGFTFPPFPGNFSVSIPPVPGLLVSTQKIIVNPAAAAGLSASQGVMIVVNNGNTVSIPVQDDTLLYFALANAPCAPPVQFYGANYESFYVSANGRLLFRPTNVWLNQFDDATPGTGDLNCLVPWAGFWTDFDPSPGSASITTTVTTSAITVQYSNVPYFGLPSTSNTFSIGVNIASGVITIAGSTIMSHVGAVAKGSKTSCGNPQVQIGRAELLGICPGGFSGTFTNHTPGIPGTTTGLTPTLFYWNGFGTPPGHLTGANATVTFTPQYTSGVFTGYSY